MIRIVCLLFVSIIVISTTLGFSLNSPNKQQQQQQQQQQRNSIIFETDNNNSRRDIQGFHAWASQQGILQENGFELLEHKNDDDNDCGDWSVQLKLSQSETVKEGMRVLQVPSHLILSSRRIQQEWEKDPQVDLTAALQYLETKNCALQTQQFYVFLKLLQESELGSTSLWYPYFQSLPRSFPTAVTMDSIEVECLPPFAWSLAKIFRIHCTAFIEALALVEGVLQNDDTKNNLELTQWAFNAVLTRCWGQDGDEARCDMVPMGDMFNHGDPANVVIHYDEDDNCNVLLKHNESCSTAAAAGMPLRLSYGKATNPSRFLSIFGFVDETQPSIFCQVLVTDPSNRHVQMGYDTSKMVFSTTNGSIAEEVWDVVLFSILEQVPFLQEEFYQSHIKGNIKEKASIRHQFLLESGIVLKKHVDSTLIELGRLLESMEKLDFKQHPRLPMIYKHNAFVYRTFSKVKTQLDEIVQVEAKGRQQQKKGSTGTK